MTETRQAEFWWLPGEVCRSLNELIDSIPDIIYTHVDYDSHPGLCDDIDRLMDEFRDVMRPYVHIVYVDEDCKVVRREK